MDDFPNLRALGNNAESLAEKLLKASDGDTQILSRLNSLPDKTIETFAKDFSQADDILAKFAKDPDLVKAWEAVGKHANIRKHIPSLQKVSDLLNDADFIDKLPNGKTDLDAIIDAVKNPLDAGTASKLVKLSDHLENVKQVVKKHSGVDGFDRLMTDLKNPAFPMQDGVTHMLNDVKNFPEGSVKKFDYEFDGDGVACTRCRFDIELTSGTPKFIEYKSWSLENIPNISGNQLTEYFRSINNLNEIKYIFNKFKTSDLGAIKTQMKSVLSNNADDIFNAMKQSLRNELGVDNLLDFIDLIDDTNSKLYNFIDIK